MQATVGAVFRGASRCATGDGGVSQPSLRGADRERLTQMTKTLLEMSNLRQVARNERIQLAPMIEEIFTDLAPLSDKLGVTLTAEGDGIMTGSDALIYRLIFNLTENAVKYNRPGGSVRVRVTQEDGKTPDSRFRHRLRHSGGVSAEHLPALLPGG